MKFKVNLERRLERKQLIGRIEGFWIFHFNGRDQNEIQNLMKCLRGLLIKNMDIFNWRGKENIRDIQF